VHGQTDMASSTRLLTLI